MCGIIGIYGKKDAKEIADKGLEMIKTRGLDCTKVVSGKDYAIGHNLHAIVKRVEQPFTKDSIFAANCEIYNWERLKKKHSLSSRNDAELIFDLIKKIGPDNILDILDELDGVFAFVYQDEKKVILARDIIGVKPLFYDEKDFSFASERKVLESLGYKDIKELNPRKILLYDRKDRNLSFIKREFFSPKPEHKGDYESIKSKTKELFKDAIHKRIPKAKVGVLLSGGIDSTLIAKVLKDMQVDIICYTAGFLDEGTKEPEDIEFAKKAAKDLGLKLRIKNITKEETAGYLKKVIPLIEDSNVIKVGVALPFYVCCEIAKEDGVRVMFSGLGSEEIYAGYERHKSALDINKECVSGLRMMYERDLYRDDVVTMNNNIELRLPFLDKSLADYSVKIPSIYKIKDGREKIIIRDIAKELGVPDYITERKKKAAQYGSRFDSAIKKLARQNGFKLKADYLNTFLKRTIRNLGVLFSSGKDSCYALWTMKKQNYDIRCLITLKSKNKASWMFHTPNIDLAELQAEAAGIPIIVHKTKGEKEIELSDLDAALRQAKEKYGIEGIITGALYSTYQRDRIEKIADGLGLKVFSPLWHIDQEKEMRQLLDEGFEIIFSSIAADGLDKSWLKKKITHDDIDKLVKIKDKIGLNVAGEGGEFESLVLDAPFFKKKIEILDWEIIEENKFTANFVVKDAKLTSK